MIDDSEKIMLGYIGFVQEEKIEKGKWGRVFLDENEFYLSVLLIAVFFDQHEELGDFITKPGKEKTHAHQIDHPKDVHKPKGIRLDIGDRNEKVLLFQGWSCSERRGNVDERNEKRERNREHQEKTIRGEKGLLLEKSPVNEIE